MTQFVPIEKKYNCNHLCYILCVCIVSGCVTYTNAHIVLRGACGNVRECDTELQCNTMRYIIKGCHVTQNNIIRCNTL